MLIEPLFPNFRAIVNLTGNMQAWSVIFMVLSGLVLIFVTTITTIILLNSRKYEIAVLRSIGMKKSRLIASYLVENFAFVWGITIAALVSAHLLTPMFSSGVYEDIQNLMSAESFEKIAHGANFGLFMGNAGIVFAGATAVVGLSLALACIDIVRFEPLKIFNKQY